MEYAVDHPCFQHRRLIVDAPILFAPRVEVAGERVRGSWGKFKVVDDTGVERRLTLQVGPIHSTPKVVIDNETPIELAEGIPWYLFALSVLPLLLMLVGGAVGGAIGATAWALNISLFRMELGTPLKLLGGVVVLGAATLTYLAFAVALQLAIS